MPYLESTGAITIQRRELRVRRDGFVRSFEQDVSIYADHELVACWHLERGLHVQISSRKLDARLAEFLADRASGCLSW